LVNVAGKRAHGPASPFSLVDGWRSRPVNDRNYVLGPHPAVNEREHYYATQLFSSIVRAERYDGICYSSSVRECGLNFALFDPYRVEIIHRRLIRYPESILPR
jgi:hypothetical protein